MIKILYIRDKFGKNHGTVAYDLTNKENGNISFAIACCNSKDVFNKHTGIAMAKDRLNTFPTLIGVRKDCSNADVVRSILTKLSRSNVASASVRKLARKMLTSYQSKQSCYGSYLGYDRNH